MDANAPGLNSFWKPRANDSKAAKNQRAPYFKDSKKVNGWWKPLAKQNENQEAYQQRIKAQKKIAGFSNLLN